MKLDKYMGLRLDYKQLFISNFFDVIITKQNIAKQAHFDKLQQADVRFDL